MFRGSILTMDNLQRQTMININACPLCLFVKEYVDHVLMNCSMDHQVWTSILSWYECSWVSPRGIGDLYDACKFQIDSAKGKSMWHHSFLVTIWRIWKEWNIRYFEGKSSSTVEVVDRSRFGVASWVFILPAFSSLSIDILILKWREVAFS